MCPTMSSTAKVLWVHIQWFLAPNISIWFSTIPCIMGPALFSGLFLPLIFFLLFIVSIGWMVHINTIKFTIHIVLGSPPTTLAISSNLVLWFIHAPGFKVDKPPNTTLSGVPYFSVSTGLGYILPYSLYCCKEISFVFLCISQTSCQFKKFGILGVCLSPLYFS